MEMLYHFLLLTWKRSFSFADLFKHQFAIALLSYIFSHRNKSKPVPSFNKLSLRGSVSRINWSVQPLTVFFMGPVNLVFLQGQVVGVVAAF